MSDTDLLGGALRGKCRPRGFVPWNPRQNSLALLEQVQSVLEEYADYLPLTCRQVFYRLVGAHGFEKTEQAYGRLCEMMNRARRARLISMDAIRDDGGQRIEPRCWKSADELLGAFRYETENARLDRQEGQRTRLVLLCEAGGMAPQLASVVDDYGLPVISSGGFDSVTEKHNLARELVGHTWAHDEVEVLHIGDHDPSGAHIFLALAEDVKGFAGDRGEFITFTRLAVTPEQIDALSLETAPPKATDNRAFDGETCQAEAIPPDLLAEIVQEAVESRLDVDAREQVLERELEIREELKGRLA